MSVIHLSPAAKRWQEVVNDPQFSQRLERIETDARGQVIMAPPPDFIHRSQAKQIQAHLDRLLGQARALTEEPIETDIGAVKIADVVWLTREQCQQLLQYPNLHSSWHRLSASRSSRQATLFSKWTRNEPHTSLSARKKSGFVKGEGECAFSSRPAICLIPA
jgi:hypothetical protein